MYDLIIIGGGPAGLTAAVYAIRKRLNVLLISKDLGGKTNYRLALPWIEEYQVIKGLEVVNKFRNELEYLDFARHIEAVDRVEKNGAFHRHDQERGHAGSEGGHPCHGDTAGPHGCAGREGIHNEGPVLFSPVIRAIVHRQVGGCDRRRGTGASLRRGTVHGCQGSDHDLRQRQESRHAARAKLQQAGNVKIMKDCEIVEVKGDEYARKLILKDKAGQIREFEADGMFVEKALTSNTGMVKDLVKLDDQGRVVVDNACRTSVPGLFAAGDVTDNYAEQVLIAVGEGAKAALSAYEYLLPKL
jgi:NADH-dependent peroxiredoxin subunit F